MVQFMEVSILDKKTLIKNRSEYSLAVFRDSAEGSKSSAAVNLLCKAMQYIQIKCSRHDERCPFRKREAVRSGSAKGKACQTISSEAAGC